LASTYPLNLPAEQIGFAAPGTRSKNAPIPGSARKGVGSIGKHRFDPTAELRVIKMLIEMLREMERKTDPAPGLAPA
jgi:hypothetical protein